MQTDVTLLAKNSQHCWMLHVKSVCRPCCMLLCKVWNKSNFSAINSLVQQCWIPLHSSSNIVGATHAHCAWFTKNGGGSFSQCIACPNIVGSCYIRLHTTANTHATMFRVVVSVCMQPDTSDDLIE